MAENEAISIEAPLDDRLKPFAYCTICQAQYPLDGTECSKCHVALSIVRRCINCVQIVSAKHRKCIYCGLQFFASDSQRGNIQDPAERIEEFRRRKQAEKQQYWLKALSVSVGTFLVVFFGVMYLTHRFEPNTERPVIASSYMLRDGKLRRTAGSESAVAGQILAGTVVEIVGYSGEAGNWVAIRREGQQAYVAADEIGPPKPKNPDAGYDVLKSYVANLNDPSVVPEAVKAVGYFNDAFPNERAKGDELRWIVAERARYLASRGKSAEELMRAARQEYEILIANSSIYAEKAKGAMNTPWSAGERGSRTKQKREPSTISLAGNVGGTQRVTGFAKSPTHEVVLLETANIAVTINNVETFSPASMVACTVAGDVLANGRVVIPAGSPCGVRISKVSDKAANMMLASVTVNNHAYSIRTATADVTKSSWRLPLHFRLVSPVAINQ